MSLAHLDQRDARAGLVVSDKHGYYDSQNIVRGAGDAPGCFSVVLHHAFGHEGGGGLRLYSTFTEDGGKTWSQLEPVEASLTRVSNDGYQLVHPTDPSKVFLFYSHGPNITSYVSAKEGRQLTLPRGDMQLSEGYHVKTSIDGGRTWSARNKATIPVRRTRIDRTNPWQGSSIGFFCCDKPTVVAGSWIYLAFQKTKEGGGETPGSEAFFLRSKDFLTVADPAKATWETLPRGDDGLQAQRTRLLLGEEVDGVGRGDTGAMSASPEPRMWTVWRTETGRLANSYSSDGGQTWEPMSWMTYSGRPGGRPLRNPRGAITPYRFLQDGPGGEARFAFLFYNNGHTDRDGYVAREVLWMTVGRASRAVRDGPPSAIEWGQPEVVQFWESEKMASRPGWNADWAIVDGPGYCDFVEPLEEDGGGLLFVASNKITVRLNRIEPRVLELMHRQWDPSPPFPREGVVARFVGFSQPRRTGEGPGGPAGSQLYPAAKATLVRCPVLPDLRARGGFTMMLWVQAAAEAMATVARTALSGESCDDLLCLGRRFFRPGARVVWGMEEATEALDENLTDVTVRKGFSITTTGLVAGPARLGGLRLHVSNGFGAGFTISTDAHGTANLCDGLPHLVCFAADGGAGIATCVVDGVLCDGLPLGADGEADGGALPAEAGVFPPTGFVPPREGDHEGDAAQGWVHIDRSLGEVGGSGVELHPTFGDQHTAAAPVTPARLLPAWARAERDAGREESAGAAALGAAGGEAGVLLEFVELDRALLTSEMVAAWKAGPLACGETWRGARL